jgi:hypothetical protein
MEEQKMKSLAIFVSLFMFIVSPATEGTEFRLTTLEALLNPYPMASTLNSLGAENFKLRLNSEEREYRIGRKMFFTLITKNISGRPLFLVDVGGAKNYAFSVKDDNGLDAKKTKFGEALSQSINTTKREVITLKPGEEVVDKIELNAIFEIGSPGGYAVLAKRKILDQDNKNLTEVTSNTLRFRIIDK